MRRTRITLAGVGMVAASVGAISLTEANAAPIEEVCLDAAATGNPDTLAACLCAIRKPIPLIDRDRCYPMNY